MKKWLLACIMLMMFCGTALADEPFKIIVFPFINNTDIDIKTEFFYTKTQVISDFINKTISEKIDQKFNSPYYFKVDLPKNQDKEYINTFPDEDYLISMTKNTNSDGIFVIEITKFTIIHERLGEIGFNGNFVLTCNAKTYNFKTNKYIEKKFNYTGKRFRILFSAEKFVKSKKFYNLLNDLINNTINKAFENLPY